MSEAFQFETLKLEISNSIGILTINRAESLNALNAQVLTELSIALTEISQLNYSEIKVLILTGAGEKAFVAGADIKEIHQLKMDSAEKFAERGQAVFRQLEKLSIPVIAAVNGFALGGGLELALACDFIYASENAKFGLPEVTLGLIPGFGGTIRLARALNLPRAKEMIYSGSMISAEEAFVLGLVNKVCSKTELLSSAQTTAENICARAPLAVAAAKRSISESYDHDVDSGMAIEATQFAALFQSQDVKEGTQAFIEKRKARFQGL